MPSNYNGRGGPKKQDGKIADKFREACPPHKVKDLDSLVKQCKGDETKIQAKIAEWWEEPQIEEPQWESVGKANKKLPEKKSYGDRGTDRGGDRGGDRGDRRHDRDRGGGGGMSGGRRGERSSYGAGRDGLRRDGRGGRGGGPRYGDRDRNRGGGDRGSQQRAPATAPKPRRDHGVPTPVSNIPPPKGAWGQGAQSFAAAAASKQPAPPPPAAPVPPPALREPSPAAEPKQLPPEETPPVVEPEEEVPVDLGGPAVNVISAEDPTPSGLPSSAAPLAPAPIAATGNVWGTKGGAHLILAEKKPIGVAPPAPAAPAFEQELYEEPEPAEPEVVPEEPEPMPVVEEPLPVEPEPEPEPEPSEPESETEPELESEPEPESAPAEPTNAFGVSTLDSVLPPSVNGANINASGWEPILDQPAETSQPQPTQQQQHSVDAISHPSPVGALSVGTTPSMPEPEPEPMSLPKPITSSPPTVQAAVAPVATTASGVKPSSVLNMGHWETGDGDDEALDFGFGSFAPENDTTEVTATTETASSSSANAPSAPPSTSQATPQVPPPPPTTTENTHIPSTTTAPAAPSHGASPARPPPGLSMPPMPANAMLVHELENKLENTALAGPKVVDTSPAVVSEKTATTSATTQSSSSQPQSFNAVNELAGQMVNPPGMSQYGGMGMYNIQPPPGVPNGLGSMPPGQFPLGNATNQQQQQPNAQQNDARSQLNQGGQQQQQQQQQPQVPYGMQQTPSATAANTNSSGVAPSNDTVGGAPGAPGAPGNNNANAGGGMPPGMPSMQYPNPAYMYAGQFSQMGHPAYGMQYGHAGYGQQPFAPPQGGHQFGYANQGLMAGQGVSGGGYGAPTHQSHYEDQVRGGPGGGPRGGGGGGNMRDNQGGGGGGGGGYQKGGGRGGYRSNRNHHQNNHSSGGGYGNNYQGNPNLGGYGVSGPYNMGYGHGVSGYGNPVGGPSGMDHYGMQAQQQQQQQAQQQGGYGGVGGGGFSHQDNDHKKSSGGGPHHQQGGGGFQQQSHLHQQPLGLQGSSAADSGTGVAGGTGGWPGSRQQHWGGNWQQEH